MLQAELLLFDLINNPLEAYINVTCRSKGFIATARAFAESVKIGFVLDSNNQVLVEDI